MERTRLELKGARDRVLANTFIRQGEETDRLAILFPGNAYGPDLPALYYPSTLLTDRGWDLLRIEHLYFRDRELASLAPEERVGVIVGDAMAAFDTAMRQRDYESITLVGKSIGTIQLAGLLDREPRAAGARCVWLTPLLKHEKVRAIIAGKRPRSFFAIGTDDEHYDADALREMVEVTGGRSCVIDGANHAIEVEGDTLESIAKIKKLVEELDAFLDEPDEERRRR